MRTLLIGGSGFLGSHVGHALAAAGHDVAALSRSRSPAVAGIEHLRADRRVTPGAPMPYREADGDRPPIPTAAEAWGFKATPAGEYLPRVVRWHLDHRPERSHPGYPQRPRELALAARHGSRAR